MVRSSLKIDIGGYILRPFRESDAPSLTELANNPRIFANVRNRFPHPYTLEDAWDWIGRAREQEIPFHFAIAADGEIVGSCGLEFFDDVHVKTVEIGYWVGEPFWGRGIATKALIGLTDYAFDTFEIERIEAVVFESNLASLRVLEKAGYTHEARLRGRVWKQEKLMDCFVWAKLRSEHEQSMTRKNEQLG